MPRKENWTWEAAEEAFPKRLTIAIEERKISQKVLADSVGIKRQTISQYCLGKSSPDFKTLCKIADYFEVSTDYLLGRTDIKTTKTSLRSVCDFTGLSEEAINKLCLYVKEQGELFNKYLSRVISNSNFPMFVIIVGAIITNESKLEHDSDSNISFMLKISMQGCAEKIVEEIAMEELRKPLSNSYHMNIMNSPMFKHLMTTIPIVKDTLLSSIGGDIITEEN